MMWNLLLALVSKLLMLLTRPRVVEYPNDPARQRALDEWKQKGAWSRGPRP